MKKILTMTFFQSFVQECCQDAERIMILQTVQFLHLRTDR